MKTLWRLAVVIVLLDICIYLGLRAIYALA